MRCLLAPLILSLGCQRAPAEPQTRGQAPPKAPQAAATAKAVVPERPYRFPAAERLVAVGDLHGDLKSTRQALRLAGAIDGADQWIGGKLVLVQVGDQLDRGDEEREILELLDSLAAQAEQSGGAVHALNGNHEIMNVAGDFRYVTADGFRDFADAATSGSGLLPDSVPARARGRALAFLPGSEYARRLSRHNTIVIVGDTLFAHAGVLPKHVAYGIGRINAEVSRFMLGELSAVPEIVAAEDAPVWTRVYGAPEPDLEACRELERVLSSLSVKRLVVGHTVQKSGINPACGERVFRVDVGLSDYYGHQRAPLTRVGPAHRERELSL
jgi:hypothetical protein